MESLDQCRRLETREKTRNVFCDEPTSVWSQGVTQHRIFIKPFFDFARIFSLISLVFRTSNVWSLRNLIKQLFHSRLLDMRLVIANSALRASLAIYHLISNARSWNNCQILYNEPMKTLGSGQSSTMNEHKTKDCAGLRPSSISMFALLSAPLKFAEIHNHSLYQLSLNSPPKSTRESWYTLD